MRAMRWLTGWLIGCWLWGLLMAQPPSLQGEGWELRYRGGRGFELRIAGATVGRTSSVQIAAPDWSRGYYSSGEGGAVSRTGDTLTIRHPLAPPLGELTETVRLLDGTTLEWSLQVRWESNSPAIVEWCIGVWNAALLIGASLRGDGWLATPVLQTQPITREGDYLFEGHELSFETGLGSITVRADSGTPFAVLDGRGNPKRGWGVEGPALWLGTLGTLLPSKQTLTLRYQLRIQPRAPFERATVLEPGLPMEVVEDGWSPQPREPVLVPPPRIVWRGAGAPFILLANQPVQIGIESDEYRAAAESLARELTRYGLAAGISVRPHPQPLSHAVGEGSSKSLSPSGGKGAGEGANELIFIGGSRELQRQYPVPDRAGAYCLRVQPNQVLIIGRFAEGAFYGVQTLIQLLQPAPNQLQIAPITIIDYPDLLFRGVHLFGGTQKEFHQRLIGNLIANLKFNRLVVECGYSQWEAIRPAWVDFSVPKANLQAIVALAQANQLEPIPLLQSLGHMYWVFRNGANTALAEDPDTPWAICPRRPAAKQLLSQLFDEVLALFPNDAFHLGLDEVTLRGRFPYSPECQGATVAELFSEHFRWLVGELQKRGVRQVMLWSDMLLAPGEAHDGAANAADPAASRSTREQVLKAIADAPKPAPELILCDWHYTPTEPDGYRSLDVLRQAGFQRIVATTWYNPQNIYTFAQAARARRIKGLLQSTWAGYSLTEQSLRDWTEQFIAYVLAATYAWNGDAPPPEQLPFDAEQFFHERYWREPIPLTARQGFLIDLRPVYNLPLSALDEAFSMLPTGRTRLNGYLFQLGDSAEARLPQSTHEQPNALMLASLLAPGEPSRYPREVVIPMGRTVRTLHILHTTGWQIERNEPVARYVLEYADGTQAELTLLYGVHVRAWNDPGAAIESPPVWSRRLESGTRVRIRLLRWQNPHPDKPVRTLRLQAIHPVAGYTLLGLSGE